jgi:hypothetical protein
MVGTTLVTFQVLCSAQSWDLSLPQNYSKHRNVYIVTRIFRSVVSTGLPELRYIGPVPTSHAPTRTPYDPQSH